MKQCINGKYVELTPEEIAECEKIRSKEEEKAKVLPPPPEERIAQLEAQNTQYELALCEIYERTL